MYKMIRFLKLHGISILLISERILGRFEKGKKKNAFC
jgi:hypothetical protein